MSSPRRAGAGGDPVEQGGAVETPGFADAAGARDLSGSEEAVEGVAGEGEQVAGLVEVEELGGGGGEGEVEGAIGEPDAGAHGGGGAARFGVAARFRGAWVHGT